MSSDSPELEVQEPPENPPLWTDIKNAIKGVRRDYTKEPLGRAIIVLSIPMVLEMSMQSVFAVADLWFVGRLHDEAAVASLATGEGLLAIVFAIGLGLSMGTTATVARRIGEGRDQDARCAAVQAILLGVFISVPICLFGAILIEPLFLAMGATETVIDAGLGFGRHMVGGCITIVLLFLINAVFRGAGDATSAMKALWLANIVNIALDPVFIFGLGPIPAMGVKGAAVATNIGRAIGVLYQLKLLFGGGSHLRLLWSDVRIHAATMRRLLDVSRVAVFQFFVGTSSYVVLVKFMNEIGNDAATGGYMGAVRIIMFVLLPAWGLGNAAATLVGQNLGAGRTGRAESAAWGVCRANCWFLSFVAACFIFIPEFLLGLLLDESEHAAAIGWGADMLRWVGFGFPFIAWSVSLMMSFNGSGDSWTPTWINLAAHWVLKLTLGWMLAFGLDMGPEGVFIAIPSAEIAACLLYVAAFRRGTWKGKTV